MWWNMFYRIGKSTDNTGPCTPVIEGDVYVIEDIQVDIETTQYLDISLEFNTVELSVDIEIEQD